MRNAHRPMGRFFLSADGDGGAVSSRPRGHAGGAAAGSPSLTQVNDTVYRADGTVAKGTVLISWPAFTTAGGYAVAAGSLSMQLGSGGALSASLAPNTGAQPAGVYYKVIYQLGDDSVQPAWTGLYRIVSDCLPANDMLPSDSVQVAAPSRQADFSAIVHEVDIAITSLI